MKQEQEIAIQTMHSNLEEIEGDKKKNQCENVAANRRK